MFLNLCPQTIGINVKSQDELIDLAVKYNFAGTDFMPGLCATKDEAKRISEKMKENNLKCGLFYLPYDFMNLDTFDDTKFENGLKDLERILPLVKEAGCHRTYNHVWPGSNLFDYDENHKKVVYRLKKLVDLLGSFDVKIGIEFIGAKTLRDSYKYPFIYSLKQALQLADDISPELGIVIDCFSWYTSESTLDDINTCLKNRKVINVHVNDAAKGKTREEQEDLIRAMPLSSGIIDAVGILGLLKKNNYDGPIICEPFFPTRDRFAKMSNDDIVSEVSDCMNNIISKL